jgi:hypothetical protein
MTSKTLKDALKEVREQFYALIAEDVKTSSRTYRQIAEKHGVSEALVYTVSRLHGLSRAGRKEEGCDVEECHHE